jgi:hypothetical protein
MAQITDLKALVDCYGVAVRAGSLTPCVEDEVYFRKLMNIPEASEAVLADWAKTGNVRQPITLTQDETEKKGTEKNPPPNKETTK